LQHLLKKLKKNKHCKVYYKIFIADVMNIIVTEEEFRKFLDENPSVPFTMTLYRNGLTCGRIKFDDYIIRFSFIDEKVKKSSNFNESSYKDYFKTYFDTNELIIAKTSEW